MTISVEPAETPAQLATFLAIGAEVHAGPWPDVATLEHELATEPRTRFLLASLDGVPVATGVGKPSSIGDALYAMARVLPGYRRRGIGNRRSRCALPSCRDGRSGIPARPRAGG